MQKKEVRRYSFGETLRCLNMNIFEVRGMHRPNKGRRLEGRVGKNQVVLSYAGLDNIVRQTCIRFDPVPKKISPSGLQFEMLVTRMREDAPRILDALRNSLKHRPSAFRSPSSLDFFQLRWADSTRDALGKTEGFAARFLVYVSSGQVATYRIPFLLRFPEVGPLAPLWSRRHHHVQA